MNTSLFTFFRRDRCVPGWLFWPTVLLVALAGLNGLHLIVTWLS